MRRAQEQQKNYAAPAGGRKGGRKRTGALGKRTVKRRGEALRAAVVCLLLTALLCYGLFLLDLHVKPVMLSAIRYECGRYAALAFNNGVEAALESESEAFDELYTPQCDENGNILAVRADSGRINRLEALLSNSVETELKRMAGENPVSIPIGTLLGWHLLAGNGPQITMNIQPEAYVTADISDTLLEVGMNQTSLKVNVHFTLHLSAMLSGYSTTVREETDVLLTDVLLVGKVPQSYWVRS